MTAPLIEHYRALERTSDRMLASARDGRWDDVAVCRQACVPMIAQLKRAAATQTLSDAEQIERLALMRRIVLSDGEVRRLASPTDDWLARMFLRVARPA